MKIFFLLLSFSVSILHAAGPKIIGGTEVSKDDEVAKMTVAVGVYDSAGYNILFCTGSILDEQTILTAAHCITGQNRTILFTTRPSMTYDVPEELKREVTGTKIHKYEPDIVRSWGRVNEETQDIATITFSGGLPAGFKPIKYLSPDDLSRVLSTRPPIIIAGVGRDENSKTGILKKVTVDIAKVGKYNLWLGNSTKTADKGDSGGPAFVRLNGELYQIGVASRGSQKHSPYSNPVIYTQFSGLDNL